MSKVSEATEAIQENIRRANELKLRSRIKKARPEKADAGMVELFKKLCNTHRAK